MKLMKIIDINGMVRDCDSVKPDTNFPGYLKVDYLSKRHPDQRLTDWYPIADFKRLNPDYAHLAGEAAPVKEALGVVTSSTDVTLKDKAQSWEPNIYQGYKVWISRGTGEGQTRTVAKNTKNTLTVDKPWEVKPDKTSQYMVSLNSYYPPASGNTLPLFEAPVTEGKK